MEVEGCLVQSPFITSSQEMEWVYSKPRNPQGDDCTKHCFESRLTKTNLLNTNNTECIPCCWNSIANCLSPQQANVSATDTPKCPFACNKHIAL